MATEIIATGTDGKVYEIDTTKKTCKRIFNDLADINIEDIDVAEMSMETYLRYLKDKFPGEGAKIIKGRLHFRGFRISCSQENGFMIEDSTKRFSVVETPFDGIPTPRELGDFFKMPVVHHTAEQLHEAAELGKKLINEAKQKVKEAITDEPAEIDYELLRKKVLGKIYKIREGKLTDFDPATFPELIPFKKWKRQVNAVVKDWKSKKIRYRKLLNLIEDITMKETFVVEEKNHKSSFVGTILPEFKNVSYLDSNKMVVDGKRVDAVPFLQAYLLHYVPKAMPQLMRFAKGEIDAVTLVQNPYLKDNTIEYNSKLLKNTEDNSNILTALCGSCDLVAPQNMVYESGLEVGDKVLIFLEGKWKKETVTEVEEGVCLNKGIGLLKTDTWVKLPKVEK